MTESVTLSGRYWYAGVEAGYQCFCDNSKPFPNLTLAEFRCNTKCYGNSTQICGGTWTLSVYEISGGQFCRDTLHYAIMMLV